MDVKRKVVGAAARFTASPSAFAIHAKSDDTSYQPQRRKRKLDRGDYVALVIALIMFLLSMYMYYHFLANLVGLGANPQLVGLMLFLTSGLGMMFSAGGVILVDSVFGSNEPDAL